MNGFEPLRYSVHKLSCTDGAKQKLLLLAKQEAAFDRSTTIKSKLFGYCRFFVLLWLFVLKVCCFTCFCPLLETNSEKTHEPSRIVKLPEFRQFYWFSVRFYFCPTCLSTDVSFLLHRGCLSGDTESFFLCFPEKNSPKSEMNSHTVMCVAEWGCRLLTKNAYLQAKFHSGVCVSCVFLSRKRSSFQQPFTKQNKVKPDTRTKRQLVP